LNKSTVYQIFLHSKENEQATYANSGKVVLKNILTQVGTRTREQSSFLNQGDFSRVIGKFFTFFMLLDFLTRCARLIFQADSKGVELIEPESLAILLDKMELSSGFNNLEKQTART
jgi:hypothetical protein